MGMALGRGIMIVGAALLLLGFLLTLGPRLPIRLGRLPGDVVYRGKNTVFYFPWVTSLLVSVVLSILFWIFGRR